MSTAIEFNNISKQYRLGLVSTRTLSHDLNRWWTVNVLRKEDPYLKIGETNDRSSKGNSEYVWALKDINFKVEQGDVVGIIGKNGAGKSTLLKLLSKVTGPTTGTIKARGRIGSLLEVGTGFHPEMTGRENIFMNGAILGMNKKEIQSKLDEIVDFSGCERYIDTPVKRYSSGMMVRLGFAVAAHLDPEILVVDEVLAVGDAEFQKKAIGKMQDVSKGEGRTVLFVSHNMASIRALCNHGVLLDKGIVKYTGEINSVVDNYVGSTLCVEGGDIIDSFVIEDSNLEVFDVTVNGQKTNSLHMEWPARSIEVVVRGSYAGKIPMDMELSILSESEVLVAKQTPSLSSGNTVKVDNSIFTVSQVLTLPNELTNGVYYLKIDLTHPKISFLARANNAVQLNVTGKYTDMGIPVDQRYFGFMYL